MQQTPTFPELKAIWANLVAGLQAFGVGVLVVIICLLGLMALTSLGNEHRLTAVRLAATAAVIGIAILALAKTLAEVILRIFP